MEHKDDSYADSKTIFNLIIMKIIKNQIIFIIIIVILNFLRVFWVFCLFFGEFFRVFGWFGGGWRQILRNVHWVRVFLGFIIQKKRGKYFLFLLVFIVRRALCFLCRLRVQILLSLIIIITKSAIQAVKDVIIVSIIIQPFTLKSHYYYYLKQEK